MMQDLRYAGRWIRRAPLVALASVLTLGLGIGGATAVFSVVDAVALRPLPFDQPERLVAIHETTPEGQPFSFSAPNYLDLARDVRALESVAAYRETGSMVLDDGEPVRLAVVPVTATLPGVLHLVPMLGRFFTPAEDVPGASPRPLVLSESVWRQRFNAAADVLGRAVVLDGTPHVVVGVMPARADFPRGAAAWVPLGPDLAVDRDDKDLSVIGRVRQGTSLAQARSEMREFGRRLSATFLKSNAGWSADAVPFDQWIVAPSVRRAVWVLFGAVAMLLLLACANVAGLLVAHGASRRGELAIRAALGAPRGRLVRQLFTESALLAALGTAAGVLVAFWSVDAVRSLGGGRVPRLDEVRVDALVLWFAAGTGAISCLAFGLAPAFHGARVDLRTPAQSGARLTPATRRLRHAIVAAEVCLAFVLMVGAGLLSNSFVRLMRTDAGFDSSALLAVPLEISGARYSDGRVAEVYTRVLERVRVLPGVTAAGASSTNPFRQFGFVNNVTPEDRAASAPPSGLVQAGWRSVTPGLLEAMRIPIRSGRGFDDRDRAGGDRVVLVSESLARQLWPGRDAVGRRIYWGGTTGRTRTVVGVVGDFQDVQLGAAPMPMLLVPHAQTPVGTMTLLVRASADAAALAPSIRTALREIDPGLPAPDVREVEAGRVAAAGGARFNLWLLGAFAAIALVLAVTGVYATLAYTVVERRSEIGVRLALGAAPRDIVSLLLGSGLASTAAGVAAGLALAVLLTRVMASLLFEVTPTDPMTFAAAALALVAAALLASYLPARRAGRLDPLTVLRE